MAALNTLRTKGGVLLSVVIGISLLAFLIGDGIGFFDQKTIVVAEIDGKKVSHTEYSATVDLLTTVRTASTGQTSLSPEETEVVMNQAFEKLIAKYSILPAYKALGLGVYDDEMFDMASGKFISPILNNLFANPQTGMYDKAALDGFLARLDMDAQNGGKMRTVWANIEEEMVNSRMSEKYNALVRAGMFVTNLQVEQGMVNNADQYSVQYVAKALNTISDESITVTDKELKAYYDKHIKRFEYADGREIEYVTFDIEPSKVDYDNAAKEAARMASELRVSDDAIQYVNYNSEGKYSPLFWSKNELPEYIIAQSENLAIGYTFEPNMEDDLYTIVRVNDIKSMPDSLEIRAVEVAADVNTDSLVNVIKGSKTGFDQVVMQYAVQAQGTEPMKIDPGKLNPMYTDKLMKSSTGDVFVYDTQVGKQLIQVVSVSGNSPKYQLAVVEFKVVPSVETEQDIFTKATAFLNAINKEGKTFEAAVADNAYIKRQATISPRDRKVNNVDNTLEIVRWAFTQKNGAVSHVVNAQTANIVAYLKKSTVKSTAPFEDVKDLIRPMYIEKAKMDLAVKELSGASSLEDLAAKTNTEVQVASDLNFTMMGLPGIGSTPEVIGALPSLKEGVVSAGIPAGSSAVAVKIDTKTPREGMDQAKVKVLLETIAKTSIEARLGAALFSLIEIKDNRVIYF